MNSSSFIPDGVQPCVNNNGENILLNLEWGSAESLVAREFSEIFADVLKDGGDIPLTVKIHPPAIRQQSTETMNGYKPNLPTIPEENGGLQFYPVLPTSEGDGFIILNAPMSLCKSSNKNVDHHISWTFPSFTSVMAETGTKMSSKVQDNEEEAQDLNDVQVPPLVNMNDHGKEEEKDNVTSNIVEDTGLDIKKNDNEMSTISDSCSTTTPENPNQEEEELNNNNTIAPSQIIKELNNVSSSSPSSSLTNTQIIMDDSSDSESTLKAVSSSDISDLNELLSFFDNVNSNSTPPVDETVSSSDNTNNNNNKSNDEVHESKIFNPIQIKIESTEDTESGYSSSQHSSPTSLTSSQAVEEPSPPILPSSTSNNNNSTVEDIDKPGPKSRKRKLPSDFEGIIGVNLNYPDSSTEYTPLDMPLTRKSGRSRKPPSRYLSEDFQSVIKDKYQKKLREEEKLKVQKVQPKTMMVIKKEIIYEDEEEPTEQPATAKIVKKARRGRPKKQKA